VELYLHFQIHLRGVVLCLPQDNFAVILHSTALRLHKISQIRGSFEKFVDSPYYSEPEFFGGAVTVSFSKYLPR
jgi:hypothetical protein